MYKPAMNKYQAVIFDLDGTLVDTLRDIAESTNHALERLSQPTFPVEAYRLKVGMGNRALLSSCLVPGQQHLIDDASDMQRAHYAEHFCDHSHPYDGIIDLLAELKNRGLKLAILSNKPAPFTPEVARCAFGEGYFDAVRGPQPDCPLKPDPTSALAVADAIGAARDRIMFVGDTGVDMQTACNAGMFAVGVTWGFRDRPELEENGAQAVIDHPRELLALLR